MKCTHFVIIKDWDGPRTFVSRFKCRLVNGRPRVVAEDVIFSSDLSEICVFTDVNEMVAVCNSLLECGLSFVIRPAAPVSVVSIY